MLDLSRDIDSLSSFKRNTPEYLRRLKEGGTPLVLTVHGKPALVVQSVASYQWLLEQSERARSMDLLTPPAPDDASDDALLQMVAALTGRHGL